ncbi:MAG: tetratricopeptide repeat-containing serine protease family protein [Spirulinaceae cyanobacterium]
MRHFLALLAMPAALVVTIETAQAQALDSVAVGQRAKPVTVRLSIRNQLGSAIGSGVIIQKEGNTYSVLTARHVVEDALEGYLFTAKNPEDGYPFDPSSTQIISGVDLAVIQFTSSRNYPVAEFGNSRQLIEGSTVFVSGFPDARYTGNKISYRFVDGTINTINTNPLDDEGYAWQYSNPTLAGMSGGGVFDQQGELVGIHGIGVRKGQILVQVNKAIPIDIYQGLSSIGGTPQLPPEEPKNSPIGDVPRDAVALLNKGYRQEVLGNYDEAISDFTRAIEIAPNYANAYNNRGATQGKLGNHEEAIADFNRAIELNPDFAEAYYGRGVEKSELGDYDEAIPDFSRAIELNPNDGYAYLKLALAYEALNNQEQALINYREAAKLHKQQGNSEPYNFIQRKIRKLESN